MASTAVTTAGKSSLNTKMPVCFSTHCESHCFFSLVRDDIVNIGSIGFTTATGRLSTSTTEKIHIPLVIYIRLFATKAD